MTTSSVDTTDSDTLVDLYNLCAEDIWDNFQYWQDGEDVPNEILITVMLLEVMRYCRTIGFTKRDMQRVWKACAADFDTLTAPPGVLNGCDNDVNVLGIIDAPKVAKKPWM